MNERTKKLTTTAVMVALATALALVSAAIPFLNLPFGGGFTLASMLPIVLISYLYGLRWGFSAAGVYSLVQIALGAFTGGGYVIALFTAGSDSYMGIGTGLGVILLDYVVAYTVLGIGGLFRKKLSPIPALVLGSIVALALRYLVHIVSGALFFGIFAEWFFGQEGFYAIGQWILETFSGGGLSIIYSVFYNGLYMIPEIIITAVVAVPVARLPQVRSALRAQKK